MTGGQRPQFPMVSVCLMVFFLVGGSVGLLLDWPDGPANLDWGVWILVYGGYAFVVAAATYHIKTGK